MAFIRVRKQGNSLYLCLPALTCKRGDIHHGDIFKIERDNLLPNVYILEKIDGSNNNI